ncbi:putative dimethyladenosine transferase [Cucumispora dikerogammari]|nr:putative dimethyladenosine transferase [Cucumispora dikerogammari]
MATMRFNKKLGQHILKNPGIVDSIVKKSLIKETDVVLEIGGGTGNLTLKLLEHAKKVIVYEIDERLASELIKRVNDTPFKNKLQLIVGDCMKHDFPHFDMCVSNIPYQISSPLIFKLMKYDFRKAVLMVQKEFSERLTARPGSHNYCRLSVSVQVLAKPQHLIKVTKKNFNPPPKVDSAVVSIEPRRKTSLNFKEFDNLLKMCFLRKNKTLASVFNSNTMFNKLKITKDVIIAVLEELKFSDKRANKLDIEDFLTLMLEFKRQGASLI